ncbi:hypothetical protein [Bartonella tamiae]|nr:hypothetical protein [Bartonella tamiae]
MEIETFYISETIMGELKKSGAIAPLDKSFYNNTNEFDIEDNFQKLDEVAEKYIKAKDNETLLSSKTDRMKAQLEGAEDRSVTEQKSSYESQLKSDLTSKSAFSTNSLTEKFQPETVSSSAKKYDDDKIFTQKQMSHDHSLAEESHTMNDSLNTVKAHENKDVSTYSQQETRSSPTIHIREHGDFDIEFAEKSDPYFKYKVAKTTNKNAQLTDLKHCVKSAVVINEDHTLKEQSAYVNDLITNKHVYNVKSVHNSTPIAHSRHAKIDIVSIKQFNDEQPWKVSQNTQQDNSVNRQYENLEEQKFYIDSDSAIPNFSIQRYKEPSPKNDTQDINSYSMNSYENQTNESDDHKDTKNQELQESENGQLNNDVQTKVSQNSRQDQDLHPFDTGALSNKILEQDSIVTTNNVSEAAPLVHEKEPRTYDQNSTFHEDPLLNDIIKSEEDAVLATEKAVEEEFFPLADYHENEDEKKNFFVTEGAINDINSSVLENTQIYDNNITKKSDRLLRVENVAYVFYALISLFVVFSIYFIVKLYSGNGNLKTSVALSYQSGGESGKNFSQSQQKIAKIENHAYNNDAVNFTNVQHNDTINDNGQKQIQTYMPAQVNNGEGVQHFAQTHNEPEVFFNAPFTHIAANEQNTSQFLAVPHSSVDLTAEQSSTTEKTQLISALSTAMLYDQTEDKKWNKISSSQVNWSGIPLLVSAAGRREYTAKSDTLFADQNLAADITFKKNHDKNLAASYIIELRFKYTEPDQNKFVTEIDHIDLETNKIFLNQNIVVSKFDDNYFAAAILFDQNIMNNDTELMKIFEGINIIFTNSENKKFFIYIDKGITGTEVIEKLIEG